MAYSPTIDDFYNDMHNVLQAYSTNDRSGLEQLYLDSETDAAIDRIRKRKGNPYYNPTPMEIKDNIPFFSGNKWNVTIGSLNDAGIEGIMKGIRYKYKDLLADPLVADRLSTIEQFLRNNRNVNVSDLNPEIRSTNKEEKEEDRILNAIALSKKKRSTKQQDDFAELLKLFSKDSSLPNLPRNIDRYNHIGKYEKEYAEAVKAEKTDKEKALAVMQENERKAKELRGVDSYEWGARIGDRLLQDPEFQKKARLL